MPKPDKRFSLRFEMKRAQGSKSGTIKIYSAIDTMKWWSDDPTVTANDFDKELTALGDVEELNIRINSPGGVVSEAIAIRSTLMRHPAKKTIDIEGCCDSAATLIACLPGAHVRMAKGSEYMIHRARRGARGTADDMLSAYNDLKKTDGDMADIYAQRTGKKPEECMELMRAETWYGAEDAKQNGFVDEVLTGEDEKEPIVACAVDEETMELMQACYDHVPERDIIHAASPSPAGEDEIVSNKEPAVAAESLAEHTSQQNSKGVEQMPELKDATAEMLNTENPTLARSIAEEAVKAERERIQQIEDMTPPGADYAQMKAEAMRSGTGAGEYLKMVVARQKEKAGGYMAARTKETASAKEVTGGSAADQDESPEAKENKWAKDVAELARDMDADTREMM
ncbi:MAG: Clp protease ClpP [Clostridia bacterium]|nr:Clp protease ClpP [Clostridia bacterium]